jgi:hypothetical protein
MRRAATLALVAGFLLSMLTAASPAAANQGSMFHGQQARVWYHKPTSPGWGVDHDLYLQFTVGEAKQLATGGSWEPVANVCGIYEETLTWFGGQLDYYRWEGCSPLTGFVFDGLSSASVTPIDGTMFDLTLQPANDAAVYGGPIGIGGYTWMGAPLSWTGNGDPSPWVIQKGELMPSPGASPGAGDRWIERYVTAAIAGVVWNFTSPGLFGPADCILAEIGEIKSAMDTPAN